MKIVRSKFFENVECETDKQREEIFKYDVMIENFIYMCQVLINDSVKDFSLFPKRHENVGCLSCYIYINISGFPCIRFYGTNMRFMFYYNKNTIKYVYTSLQRNSLTFNEIKDVMSCWDDISRLIRQFSKDVNGCGRGIDNACLEFDMEYRNTGKTLYQVISLLKYRGYTDQDILKAIITVLRDVTFDE